MRNKLKNAAKINKRMSMDAFDFEKRGELVATLSLASNDSGAQRLGEVGGLQWSARAIKDGDQKLTVLLSVDHADSSRWSYEVDVSASVVSTNSKSINLGLVPNKDNNAYAKEHCWIETCPWSEVTHKECYDTKNSSVTVSFKINIISSSGTNPRRIVDFCPETDHLNDVKLVVEGKTIAVSKNYLSLHSSYFNALFYRDFIEKNKGEIELPDVKYGDVINILKMIYPSRCKVTSSTVEGVLLLADLWDISIVTRKCDKYLSKDVVKPASTDPQKVPLAKKVLYASKYALPQLQHALLSAFNKKLIVEVMESIEYKEEYSDSDRVYLLKRFKYLQ